MDIDFLISIKNNCKMVKITTKFKNMCKTRTEGECKGNLEIFYIS